MMLDLIAETIPSEPASVTMAAIALAGIAVGGLVWALKSSRRDGRDAWTEVKAQREAVAAARESWSRHLQEERDIRDRKDQENEKRAEQRDKRFLRALASIAHDCGWRPKNTSERDQAVVGAIATKLDEDSEVPPQYKNQR